MVTLFPTNESPNTLWDKVGIPSRGKALHSAINKGFSYGVFFKLTEYTGVDKKELAECLSISPATLHRRSKTGQFTTAESDKLYRFAHIFDAAKSLFEGNREEAITWLRSNNKGLGELRPLDMLTTSAECDTVKDLLGRLESGVFA